MAGPAVRCAAALAALGLGAVWWWAVLRLVLSGDAGVLEGAVAAGGWGLSLLPVHCAPKDSVLKDSVLKDSVPKGSVPEGAVPEDEERDH
ncbi:hypothetical protein [Streptomyces sp. MK5]|uniref:hypothetical protein n=1 Tax=Streptomyces sp. MK5 TaxID=3064253 RepID=UPI0027425338|nr:hypothetical protein [Streptomyces sp. MK5]